MKKECWSKEDKEQLKAIGRYFHLSRWLEFGWRAYIPGNGIENFIQYLKESRRDMEYKQDSFFYYLILSQRTNKAFLSQLYKTKSHKVYPSNPIYKDCYEVLYQVKERKGKMYVTETDAAKLSDETLKDFVTNPRLFSLSAPSLEVCRNERLIRRKRSKTMEKTQNMISLSSMVGRRGSAGRAPSNAMTYYKGAKHGKVAIRVPAILMKEARLYAGDRTEILWDGESQTGILSLSENGRGMKLSPQGSTKESRKNAVGTFSTSTIGFQGRPEMNLPDRKAILTTEVRNHEIHFAFPE